MRKRLFLLVVGLVLVFCLMFSLIACQKTNSNEDNQNGNKFEDDNNSIEMGYSFNLEVSSDDKSYYITGINIKDNASVESITIPSINANIPIVGIKEKAFYECKYLKHVTLPDSIITIGDSAFENCNNLISINTPTSLESIGNKAFAGCDKLEKFDLLDSIDNIADNAFSGCKLKDVVLPIKYINKIDLSKINSLTITNGDIADESFSGNNILEYVTFCSGVGWIGDNSFMNCPNLKVITFENGVESIGKNAFSACEKLEEIHISASITNIGNMAFTKSFNLKKVSVDINNSNYKSENNCLLTKDGTSLKLGSVNTHIVPSTVQTIEKNAFAGSNITFIYIPKSVTKIQDFAFAQCEKITNFIYEGSQAEYESIKNVKWDMGSNFEITYLNK